MTFISYVCIPEPLLCAIARSFLFHYMNPHSFGKVVNFLETRIALIGIIVEDTDSTDKINDLLHEYSNYIIGRMGIPHRQKNISIISIVIDADNNTISSLSGKLGMIKGISVKTVYSKK